MDYFSSGHDVLNHILAEDVRNDFVPGQTVAKPKSN